MITKKKKVFSPDNRHISLGEELPCHLNELEEDGAPTILLTPGVETTLGEKALEMRKSNLAFISARSPATAASSRPRGLRTPRVGGQDGYSKIEMIFFRLRREVKQTYINFTEAPVSHSPPQPHVHPCIQEMNLVLVICFTFRQGDNKVERHILLLLLPLRQGKNLDAQFLREGFSSVNIFFSQHSVSPWAVHHPPPL